MKVKRIGLVGWLTGSNSFGATIPYVDFFSRFGIVEIIMPNEKNVRNIDLLIMPGGPDVDTNRYLEDGYLDFNIGKPCPFRERFDKILLPKYIESKTPIFGICRGLQSLAVYEGASLIQDMWHETNKEHDRNELVHKIVVEKHLVREIGNISVEDFESNSMHHQVIDERTLPETLKVIARYNPLKTKEVAGSIEAITAWPNYPMHAVQWHPEHTRDRFSINLIQHLLSLKKEGYSHSEGLLSKEVAVNV